MQLKADNHEMTAEWVRKRIPKVEAWLPGFKTIRVEEDGKILAAVVYDGFTPFDCNVHIAVAHPAGVSRKTIHAVFAYPFKQLKLVRVTALINSGNEGSQKFVARLGFICEGLKRQGFGSQDEMVFGLLASECKWL